MPRKVNIWRTTDWFTIALYIFLVILGWLNIYAAVFDDDHQYIFDLSQRYGKQMLWIMAAFVIGLAVLLTESRFYAVFGYVIYFIMMALLVGVLLFGTKVNDSRSWFEIGAFRIQPSEFAKFATALALAKFMSSYNFNILRWSNLFVIVGIIGFPMLLILLQPDAGSTLVYLSFLLVLYREGLWGQVLFLGFLLALLFIYTLLVSLQSLFAWIIIISVLAVFLWRRNWRETGYVAGLYIGVFTVSLLIKTLLFKQTGIHVVMFVAALITSVVYVYWSYKRKFYFGYFLVAVLLGSMAFTFTVDYIFHNVLKEHHRNRIEVLLGQKEDAKGVGYNVHQSKIAIGSGGMWGKGFLQGTQTKYNFVPEQSTDFIFCTVGEEWGFVGSMVVVLIFLTLLIRIIMLAERQKSAFSRVYGYCVASILFMHIAINIAMTIGLAPVIGIPLPFFSYGGSSLWAFTILLMIFVRLDASRAELL